MKTGIEVVRATASGWAPGAQRLAEWAGVALGRRRGDLCIRIVGAAESRRLNKHYLGHDYATNVLSFPAGDAMTRGAPRAPIGDIAICATVVAREARAQAKTLAAHWAHMVVHGVLHLCGYDHVRDRDALRMERRERLLLRRLGFADPYRER